MNTKKLLTAVLIVLGFIPMKAQSQEQKRDLIMCEVNTGISNYSGRKMLSATNETGPATLGYHLDFSAGYGSLKDFFGFNVGMTWMDLSTTTFDETANVWDFAFCDHTGIEVGNNITAFLGTDLGARLVRNNIDFAGAKQNLNRWGISGKVYVGARVRLDKHEYIGANLEVPVSYMFSKPSDLPTGLTANNSRFQLGFNVSITYGWTF